MSEKHKKVYRALKYFENFLIFVSSVSGCVPISAFTSLLDGPIGIFSFASGLKICVITSGTNKYNLVIKKEEKAKTQVKYY